MGQALRIRTCEKRCADGGEGAVGGSEVAEAFRAAKAPDAAAAGRGTRGNGVRGDARGAAGKTVPPDFEVNKSQPVKKRHLERFFFTSGEKFTS
jgi:hypothetical protein